MYQYFIPTTRRDLEVYIDDVRPDVRQVGGTRAVEAAVGTLTSAPDVPPWGTDWSLWLAQPAVQKTIDYAVEDLGGAPHPVYEVL